MAQTVKNPPAKAGDPGSIPGLGTSPGEGHGNPFQYSCLENSMDRGAWWATVHGVAELDMTSRVLIDWQVDSLPLAPPGKQNFVKLNQISEFCL